MPRRALGIIGVAMVSACSGVAEPPAPEAGVAVHDPRALRRSLHGAPVLAPVAAASPPSHSLAFAPAALTPVPWSPSSSNAPSLLAMPTARIARRPTPPIPVGIAPMPDRSGRYVMRRGESSTMFTQTGFTVSVASKSDTSLASARRGWGLRFTLDGACDGTLTTELPSAARVNHLVGASTAWISGVPTFERLAWEEIYPGVDMVAEPAPGGLAYRFVLSPGARLSDVAMRWEGATNVRVTDDGRGLDVETEIGVLRVRGLRAFAMGAERKELAVRHVLASPDRISLVVDGWDGSVPLVVDPTVAWSSYHGGGGGSGAENVAGVAVDGTGDVFVTGTTQSGGFATAGAFDTTLGFAQDAFVSKITSAGALVWTTYLGGNAYDNGQAIATDPNGNVFVAGTTGSSDFPTSGGFDVTIEGDDAFITKLTSSGALVWSSALGGSATDGALGIAVDGSGNAVVSGHTFSSDFLTTGGFDTTLGGGWDGFVIKVSGAGAVVWSTYLGGSSIDEASSVAVDASGNVLVAGMTQSADYPSAGGFDTTRSANQDAVITKLSPTGALVWSSYLGGNGRDAASGIALDSSGNAYVAGTTDSTDFPTTGGFDTTYEGPEEDGFLTKVSASGSLLWSSYVGGFGTDRVNAVAVLDDDAFVVGDTRGGIPTPGGFDTTYGGGSYVDAFVARVRSGGTMAWTSFLGGSTNDSAFGIAVHASGSAYVVGSTASTDFPSAGGFDNSRNGTDDGFVTKLSFAGAGTSCAVVAECRSAYCVDNVCCDKACTGTCEACSTTKKGGGSNGACGFVVDGVDPGVECPGAACTSGVVTTAQVCNGAGACRSTGSTACSPYVCAGPICGTNCSSDAACAASAFCSGTTCTADLDLGAACVRAAQCKTGNCVDGFCCDSTCSGSCEACSAARKGAGANGTCGFVVDGSDPVGECSAQTCSSGVVTKARVCNGTGACRGDGTIACGLYPCSGASCATTCGADGDCVGSAFCNVTSCTADLDPGAACTRASQCKSGHCADGVCCDAACGGACQACSAAKKGSGTDGVCANVAADTDPKNACTIGSGTCAADGLCDGVGNCRGFAKAGSPCGATTCTSGVVTGRICKGDSATCVDDAKSCGLYACGGLACTTSCTSDTDCVATAFCSSTGACVAKLAQGAACGAAHECSTGSCVDSVCCNAACNGQCESCTEPGAVGTCLAVSGTPRSGRAACDTRPDDDCAKLSCNGSIRDKCAGFANGVTTACGVSACAAGKFQKNGTCDGLGACARPDPQSCAPFVCDAAAASGCKTLCSSDTECDATAYCGPSSACTPKLAQGAACTSAKECSTGVCADGVCCNTACGGQCESCNETGTAGTCTAVSGNPRAARAACDALPATNCGKRACDGSTRDTCAAFVNGATTACGADACTTDKRFQRRGTCDGAGACASPEPQNCTPYVCDLASSTGCKPSCSSASDCADGFRCTDGKCLQGSTCSGDGLSVVDVNGVSASCGVTRCKGGRCLELCNSSDDCAPSYICDPTSNACKSLPSGAAEDSGGCACSTIHGSSEHGFSLVLVAALVALARRRR